MKRALPGLQAAMISQSITIKDINVNTPVVVENYHRHSDVEVPYGLDNNDVQLSQSELSLYTKYKGNISLKDDNTTCYDSFLNKNRLVKLPPRFKADILKNNNYKSMKMYLDELLYRYKKNEDSNELTISKFIRDIESFNMKVSCFQVERREIELKKNGDIEMRNQHLKMSIEQRTRDFSDKNRIILVFQLTGNYLYYVAFIFQPLSILFDILSNRKVIPWNISNFDPKEELGKIPILPVELLCHFYFHCGHTFK